jgi:hypothetical protein
VSTRVTSIRVSHVRSARLTSSRSARRSGAAAPRVKLMRARLEVEQTEIAPVLADDPGPQIVVLSSTERPLVIL